MTKQTAVDGTATPPPIIDRAAGLLARYEAVFCDVWGVVHDGHRAHPSADKVLRDYRKTGGVVILVSNAPAPKQQVASMLDYVGLSKDAWDTIVSSGDIALRHVAEMNYKKLYTIGPKDRDAALFAALPDITTDLQDADALLCSGLNDDINETAADYRKILQSAKDANLPFVCANPDKVVDVGGKLYLCAGAIADLYEEMNGEVYWAGKPHISAYGTALEDAEAIAGKIIPKSKLLAIGDSLRNDMKAAEVMGIDALFVAGGIHRKDTMANSNLCTQKLAELLKTSSAPICATIAQLG